VTLAKASPLTNLPLLLSGSTNILGLMTLSVGQFVARLAPSLRCPGGAQRVSVRLLFRVQELVNVVFERIERERPDQEFDGFDLRAVSLGIPEEEGRGARHADFLTLFQTGIDLVSVFATVKTGLEDLYVQPQCLGMLHQRLGLQQLLIVEQAFVHRLAFPLVVGTPKRLGGFAGKRVNRLQRKVARHIFELPRRNVRFLDLWQRLTDVSATEGSLVVSEFDERERGLFVAFWSDVADHRDSTLLAPGQACIASRTSLLS
jgi:hypothetical protein